ncbi:MAG: hypothetical protein CSYNP_03059 [Syntrophus sp. SKADARSKE-3]|nr:hypothetical protein [Syntrophus sp. SKADARSKE-3]
MRSGRLLKNSILVSLFKNIQMQGAQKSRNEAYIEVHRMTRLAAQRRRWAFFNRLLETAVGINDRITETFMAECLCINMTATVTPQVKCTAIYT